MSKNAIFIQIPGVTGSATESNHKGWIPVESFSWRMKRPIKTKIGNARHRFDSSALSFSEFVLIKEKDASSAKIVDQILKTTVNPNITIHVCDSINNGLQTYVEYVLNNVVITHYEEAASTHNKRPKELIALDFTNFQKKHTTFDTSNKPLAPIVTTYNLETARAG